MKILHAVHGFPPELRGGTEQYVAKIAGAQAARGHHVAVLTGSLQSSEPPTLMEDASGPVRVLRYYGPPTRSHHWSEFSDPIAEALVRQFLTAERPEVVHVHHWLRLTSRIVVMSAELGIPAVVTLHDTWAVCPRTFRLKEDYSFCQEPYREAPCMTCAPRMSWETDPIRSGLLTERQRHLFAELETATTLIVPSATHRDFVARLGQIPPDRFEVLPHPTLTRIPAQPPGSHAAPRDRPLRIGCWGALAPPKGQDVLLRALPLLPETPPWEIHILGSPEDLEFEAALRRLAQDYPVAFHGEYCSEDLVDARLDLAVFPALAPESFSFALDDALQLGLPMIVSDRGALAERAEGAALVVPAGDPEALGKTLRRILEDPSILAGLRSRSSPRRAADLNVHLDRLDAIYAAARTAVPARPTAITADLLDELRYREVLELERAWQEREQARVMAAAQLEHIRKELADRLASLQGQLADQLVRIEHLEAANFELTHSRGFKMLTLLRELKGMLNPTGVRTLPGLIREGGLPRLGRLALARARHLGRLAYETVISAGDTRDPRPPRPQHEGAKPAGSSGAPPPPPETRSASG